MLLLILLLIIGSGLAYVSHYNFMPVSLHLGPYVVSDVPLFYVIIGSLVTGLLLSYVAYLINSLSASLALRAKDQELKRNQEEILDLTKRVHKLELENKKIKKEAGIEVEDTNAL